MTILHVQHKPQKTDTMAEMLFQQTAHSSFLCSTRLAQVQLWTGVFESLLVP